MTVRPIDVVTMLPRVHESGRLQQQHDQSPVTAQHVAALQGLQRSAREMQQVHQKARTDGAMVQKDGSRNGGARQEQRRRAEPAAKETEPPQPRSGHRLDVKL